VAAPTWPPRRARDDVAPTRDAAIRRLGPASRPTDLEALTGLRSGKPHHFPERRT